MKEAGIQLYGVGEMGIGNTTTSSAVLSSITGEPAEVTVGRGGGLNDEGLAIKIKVVDEAASKLMSGDHDMISNIWWRNGRHRLRHQRKPATCGYHGAGQRRIFGQSS